MIPDNATAFTPYQTDPLFLLIGTNPLPNYVAAQLLALQGGTIYLLHSRDTFEVADRLMRRLKLVRPDAHLIPLEIDESDGDRIVGKVNEIIKGIGRGTLIGLNYSGGTKSMAVHTYYALRTAFPHGVFSYLDPRKLEMVIDPGPQPVRPVPVGHEVQVKLPDLLQMHGYKFKLFNRQPRWEALCAAIARVFAAPDSRRQWEGWLRACWPRSNQDQLPASPLCKLAEYSLLQPVLIALGALCDGTLEETTIARALGMGSFRSCEQFFRGKWLEEFVLAELKKVEADRNIHDSGSGIQIWRKDKRSMELDVLAMRGYQLFAISCMATENRDAAEYHLHEIFVRARQIGGDEAHFALVCAYDQPFDLQNEVSEAWDAENKIKVFGQDDLLALPDRFRQWLKTATP